MTMAPYALVIKRMGPLAGTNNQPRVVTRNTVVCRVCIVGMAGFEPATPCSQSRCATKLRHIPCCCVVGRFALQASDHLCSVFSKDSNPKSKPDAVSRWKGDFQRFRYLFAVLSKRAREGLMGMLFSQRTHTQTPDGANADFRSATPYVIPDHGVRRIRLIRAAGGCGLIIQHCPDTWWSPRWDSNPHALLST